MGPFAARCAPRCSPTSDSAVAAIDQVHTAGHFGRRRTPHSEEVAEIIRRHCRATNTPFTGRSPPPTTPPSIFIMAVSPRALLRCAFELKGGAWFL